MISRFPFKAVALLLIGAFGVQELRSMASLGGHSGHDAAGFGGWLVALAPVLSVLMAVGFVLLLVASVSLGRGSRAGVDTKKAAVVCALIVAHIYGTQELLQVVLGDGHAVGLHGLFDHGGWILVPVAIVLTTTVLAFVRALASFSEPRRFLNHSVPLPPDGPELVLHELTTWRSDQFVGASTSGRGPPSFVV